MNNYLSPVNRLFVPPGVSSFNTPGGSLILFDRFYFLFVQKLKVHQSDILRLTQFFLNLSAVLPTQVDFLIFRIMTECFKDSTYISFLRFSLKFLDQLLICLKSITSSGSHNVKQLRVIVFEKVLGRDCFQ